MHRIHSSSYGQVFSTVALLGVIGGSALVVNAIPGNSVGAKQIKTNAVRSAEVKNGSLLARDFKAGQLPRGATGPAGSAGPAGATGATGPAGANFTADTTLASGKTLSGQWSAWGHGGGYAGDAVSYRLPLAATPAANSGHYIAGAFTAQCPGIGQAAAGHLCVYQSTIGAATLGGIYAVEAGSVPLDRGSKDGFQIYFTTTGAVGSYAYGTWAVTAP